MENKDIQNFLQDIYYLNPNEKISESFISTPIIYQNNNYNSSFKLYNALSPNYNTKNDETNINANYTNIHANSNIYYFNHNSAQTPLMNFSSNITNTVIGTQNEKNKNIEIKKLERITSNTNDSSENIQLEILPKIENVVSTVNLCCELNLREIALQTKNAEYNPKRFSAVIMKIKEPKTTALIFSSGRMVCLGAKNEEESKKACRKFAKIIKSLGYPVVFKEFVIQNIVGSADVKFKISLIKLYIQLIKKINIKGKRFVAYEPENFPGLIYRMIEPNIVLLICVSGKLVLAGGKVRDDIYKGFKKIYRFLAKFKIEEEMRDNKLLHHNIVEKMKEIKDGNKLNIN